MLLNRSNALTQRWSTYLLFFLFSPLFLQRRWRSAPARAVLRGCSDRAAGSSRRYHVQFRVLWAKRASVGTASSPQKCVTLSWVCTESRGCTVPEENLGGEAALKMKCLLSNYVTCTGVRDCFCDCQTLVWAPVLDVHLNHCKHAPERQGTNEPCDSTGAEHLQEVLIPIVREIPSLGTNSPEYVWIGWVLKSGKQY